MSAFAREDARIIREVVHQGNVVHVRKWQQEQREAVARAAAHAERIEREMMLRAHALEQARLASRPWPVRLVGAFVDLARKWARGER